MTRRASRCRPCTGMSAACRLSVERRHSRAIQERQPAAKPRPLSPMHWQVGSVERRHSHSTHRPCTRGLAPTPTEGIKEGHQLPFTGTSSNQTLLCTAKIAGAPAASKSEQLHTARTKPSARQRDASKCRLVARSRWRRADRPRRACGCWRSGAGGSGRQRGRYGGRRGGGSGVSGVGESRRR